MKILIVWIVILFLSQLCAPAAQPLQQQQKTKIAETIYLVGKVSANAKNSFQPDRYCLQEEKALYKGFDWRFGTTNLQSDDGVSLVAGQTYLFSGYYQKDLTGAIEKIASCNPREFGAPEHRMMQIRSDWLPPENRDEFEIVSWIPGLTNRKALQKLSYFHVKAAKQVRLINHENRGSKIKFIFTNSFDFTLPVLRWRAHYEGGRGKPQARYKSLTIPSLVKGKSFSVMFARRLNAKDKRRGHFRLQEVSISGGNQKITFDLTISDFR